MRSLAILLLLILAGCSSTPPPISILPFSVQSEIIVGSKVNPYGEFSYHPLALRFYQLREPGAFTNSEFIDIYIDDRKALGASLVDVLYIDPMLPGQHSLTLEIQRSTRYLGVFAEFAEYREANGRALVKLEEEPDLKIVLVNVNGLSIDMSLQEKPAEKSWWQLF